VCKRVSVEWVDSSRNSLKVLHKVELEDFFYHTVLEGCKCVLGKSKSFVSSRCQRHELQLSIMGYRNNIFLDKGMSTKSDG